jgi:hypothetical protein
MSNKLIFFLVILSSCQAPDDYRPIKTPNYVRSYTIQVQPTGGVIFPKFVPILKYNGK